MRPLPLRSSWSIALLVFGLGSLLFHLPAVALGLIPSEDDVETFFFPFLVATARALREGTVRLWTPSIFGGYPLFADGEAGMLYPFHLILLPRLTPEGAFVALRVLHTFLAATFTYYLLRTLRVGPLGGTVGGLTYALSGFAAAQVVHTNVFQGMVWLPLELALAERICASTGIAGVPLDRLGWPRLGGILSVGPGTGQRYRYAALAGAAFGIQALGSHVHVTLMSGMAVSAFFAYRWVVGPWRPPGLLSGLPGPWRWPVSRLAAALTIGLPFVFMAALGVAVAAAQLLPLYELGTRTYRSSGLAEPLASINSIWPGDLLILLLPHLHWTGADGFWGPWVKWETVLYVGIIPLVLACVGLLKGRGPYRPFFLLLSVAALLLTLGPYAPLPLWDELRNMPGFTVLRSPGRFALLLALGVAVGAAYGVDWLGRRPPSPLTGLAVGLAGALAVLAAALGLELASLKLLAWVGSGSHLFEQYLELPGIPLRVDGAPLDMRRATQLAAEALTVWNPATAWQLSLALASVAALALWLAGGHLRPVAALATVGLVVADLWVFSLRMHPYAPISTLRPQLPSVLLQPSDQPFRVFTPPTTRDKESDIDPNRAMIARVQEANGYSSLERDRHYAYVRAVRYADNHLLDLWNVRYLVRFNRQQLFPSYGGVSFHPQRPLFSGKRDTPGAGGALLPEGAPARTSEVRVVGGLWDAASVEDNQPIAHIVLESPQGERRQMRLLAGRDLADMATEVPGDKLAANRRRADVAFVYQREDPGAENYGEQLYYARLAVAPPFQVNKVLIEHADGEYGLQIYGVGLLDRATGEVTQARTKAKYRLVHSDLDFQIYENRQVMPRAFLVERAVSPPPELDTLSFMMDGPFDPAREVVLPRSYRGAVAPTIADAQPGPVGTSAIERYEAERVIPTSALGAILGTNFRCSSLQRPIL